jgi:hypothetical protein
MNAYLRDGSDQMYTKPEPITKIYKIDTLQVPTVIVDYTIMGTRRDVRGFLDHHSIHTDVHTQMKKMKRFFSTLGI